MLMTMLVVSLSHTQRPARCCWSGPAGNTAQDDDASRAASGGGGGICGCHEAGRLCAAGAARHAAVTDCKVCINVQASQSVSIRQPQQPVGVLSPMRARFGVPGTHSSTVATDVRATALACAQTDVIMPWCCSCMSCSKQNTAWRHGPDPDHRPTHLQRVCAAGRGGVLDVCHQQAAPHEGTDALVMMRVVATLLCASWAENKCAVSCGSCCTRARTSADTHHHRCRQCGVVIKSDNGNDHRWCRSASLQEHALRRPSAPAVTAKSTPAASEMHRVDPRRAQKLLPFAAFTHVITYTQQYNDDANLSPGDMRRRTACAGTPSSTQAAVSSLIAPRQHHG